MYSIELFTLFIENSFDNYTSYGYGNRITLYKYFQNSNVQSWERGNTGHK